MEIEIRSVIHFLFLKGHSNKEIHKEIILVYGNVVIKLMTVQKWTKRFGEGDYSLDDKPRGDRLVKNELVDKIKNMLKEEPYLSKKKIVSFLELSTGIVSRILRNELGLNKVNFRWIPHTLNDHQKLKRTFMSDAIYH